MNLVDRLKQAAVSTAKASQMIADAKTSRNQAAGDLDAKYLGLEAHETLEWKAAEEIWCLREVLRGVRIMDQVGAFKERDGEPWLKRVRNIDLES